MLDSIPTRFAVFLPMPTVGLCFQQRLSFSLANLDTSA